MSVTSHQNCQIPFKRASKPQGLENQKVNSHSTRN